MEGHLVLPYTHVYAHAYMNIHVYSTHVYEKKEKRATDKKQVRMINSSLASLIFQMWWHMPIMSVTQEVSPGVS